MQGGDVVGGVGQGDVCVHIEVSVWGQGDVCVHIEVNVWGQGGPQTPSQSTGPRTSSCQGLHPGVMHPGVMVPRCRWRPFPWPHGLHAAPLRVQVSPLALPLGSRP
jgi:hypothetical protein